MITTANGNLKLRYEQITWVRYGKLAKTLISHPWQWIVTEPDGYERCFDTKREARQWIAENYGEER